MADFFGTSLNYVSTFNNDPFSTAPGLLDVETAKLGGSDRFVYALNDRDDTISVLQVSDAGAFSYVTRIFDTTTLALGNPVDIEVFSVGFSGSFLAVAGYRDPDATPDPGVSVFQLSDGGSYITARDTVFQSSNANLNLTNIDALESIQISDFSLGSFTQKTFLYATGSGASGLSVFQVTGAGNLIHVQDVDHNSAAGIFLVAAQDLTHFTFNDANYLAAVTDGGDITLFDVNDDGELSLFASIDPTFFGFHPQVIAVKAVDGGLGIYTIGPGGDSIRMYDFDGSGFTEGPVYRSNALVNMTDLKLIEVGDRTLLVATSEGRPQANSQDTGALSIFEVDKAPLSSTLRELTPLATTYPNPNVFDLEGPAGFDSFTVNDQTFLLVAEEDDNAVTLLSLGGGADLLEGTPQDDTLKGFGSDDVLYGFDGSDTLEGGDGDDTAHGGAGNDTVLGGAGDDTLYLGAGMDTAEGGAGADTIYGGSGNDEVRVGPGQDVLFGGSGADLITAETHAAGPNGVVLDLLRGEITLGDGTRQQIFGFELAIGSAEGDLIVGDDASNALSGGQGDDLVRGRAGDDLISGNDGDDVLVGANGLDFMDGGAGDDRVSGGGGDDQMLGGDGADRMFGGTGDDQMAGNIGDDQMKGNGGDDEVDGGAGNDRLEGQQGDDVLRGQDGADVLIGGGGRDRLQGGAGDDSLTGGSAVDTFVFLKVASGGGGTDTITDFQDLRDLIDLSDYEFENVNDVLGGAEQIGADVWIGLADGQIVVLADTVLTSLGADNFVL